MNKQLGVRVCGVLASLCLANNSVWSIGAANIGNEVPSARAAGQGYVGIAGQSDDPTVVYSNPAAISKLPGTQFSIGGHWENINGSYTNDAGAETKARPINVVVPNLSLTQTWLEGKIGTGVSVQSPFGLETRWPSNSSLRYVSTNSRLQMVLVSPAISYKPHSTVSFGLGADYANLFGAQLERHVNIDALNAALLNPTAQSPDGVSSLRGDGSDWGYHAALLFEPHKKHAIGVVYRSRITIRTEGNVSLNGLSGASAALFGGSNYNTSAYTDVNLPESVQLGYALKPTDRWHWEANAAWYRWSAQKNLNIRFGETDPIRLAVLNTGNPTSLDLRDAWSFATGVNYKAGDKWQWRGGFWYEPWAQPEQTFQPSYLDLSRYGLSAGFGYQLTENWTLDAAYSAVFFKKRIIHNNVGNETTGIPDSGIPSLGVPAADIDGTYRDFANLMAINLTYRFGLKK